jgi:FAD-dependent urate hydroxylase
MIGMGRHDKLDCQVAVVGAGPYGLAVAAHLARAGIETRVFGSPLSFWRKHMPKGMNLRSALSASDIADPEDALTLDAYAREHGLALEYPLPLDEFLRYAHWRLERSHADIESRLVRTLEKREHGFRLGFVDGASVLAHRVVIAAGLDNQEFRPSSFRGLPCERVSHGSEHEDFTPFFGKRVAVVGVGQSGCESAALLSEHGAKVDLFAREEIRWAGKEDAADSASVSVRNALRRLTATKYGVGPFPHRYLSEFPELLRRLPAPLRAKFIERCLRPSAASWVKPRLRDVTFRLVKGDLRPEVSGSAIRLRVEGETETYDHVLLATGYKTDISRLEFIAPNLLARIQCADGSPVLTRGFESSVDGLHFVGSSAVHSFGPLMRFVAGTRYAARHLTQSVVTRRAARPRQTEGSPDLADRRSP